MAKTKKQLDREIAQALALPKAGDFVKYNLKLWIVALVEDLGDGRLVHWLVNPWGQDIPWRAADYETGYASSLVKAKPGRAKTDLEEQKAAFLQRRADSAPKTI